MTNTQNTYISAGFLMCSMLMLIGFGIFTGVWGFTVTGALGVVVGLAFVGFGLPHVTARFDEDGTDSTILEFTIMRVYGILTLSVWAYGIAVEGLGRIASGETGWFATTGNLLLAALCAMGAVVLVGLEVRTHICHGAEWRHAFNTLNHPPVG